MGKDLNSPGRDRNAAEPPGKFTDLGGEKTVERTGEESRRRAGPDGGDAREVGDIFKRPPPPD